MPLKMPRHTGGTPLETLLRPSGLQNMNAQQQLLQYNKLVQMRSELAQRNREDNAMREFQRMAGAGAFPTQPDEDRFNLEQARRLEMSDVLLQERPFSADPAGGFTVSGAERAGARTQARRAGMGRPAPPAAQPGVPPPPPPVGPRRRGGLGLAGIFRTPGAT